MNRTRDLDLTIGLTVPNDGGDASAAANAWTYADVQDVLSGSVRAIMADTLHSGDMPATVQALWPAIRRETMEAYGRGGPSRLRPARPDPQTLDQAVEAIAWLLWIKQGRTRRIVFGRLCGIKWAKLARLDGRSRQYLQTTIFRDGLQQIADRLNRSNPRTSVSAFTQVTNFCR